MSTVSVLVYNVFLSLFECLIIRKTAGTAEEAQTSICRNYLIFEAVCHSTSHLKNKSNTSKRPWNSWTEDLQFVRLQISTYIELVIYHTQIHQTLFQEIAAMKQQISQHFKLIFFRIELTVLAKTGFPSCNSNKINKQSPVVYTLCGGTHQGLFRTIK